MLEVQLHITTASLCAGDRTQSFEHLGRHLLTEPAMQQQTTGDNSDKVNGGDPHQGPLTSKVQSHSYTHKDTFLTLYFLVVMS